MNFKRKKSKKIPFKVTMQNKTNRPPWRIANQRGKRCLQKLKTLQREMKRMLGVSKPFLPLDQHS